MARQRETETTGQDEETQVEEEEEGAAAVYRKELQVAFLDPPLGLGCPFPPTRGHVFYGLFLMSPNVGYLLRARSMIG